jgi:hypothetical protein
LELFFDFKYWASEVSHLDRDSLHIHVSLVAYMLVCLVLRTKASTIWPWLAVLCLAFAGEYLDGQKLLETEFENYPDQATLWRFHGKDMINTMIAPTLLFLAARFTKIFEKPTPKATFKAENKTPDADA